MGEGCVNMMPVTYSSSSELVFTTTFGCPLCAHTFIISGFIFFDCSYEERVAWEHCNEII